MKIKALQLFLILLVSLIFCCCLGAGFREGLEMKTGTKTPTKPTEPTKHVVTPNGQQVEATHDNTVKGIPQSQIPSGHEDLYIRIVPPVCPVCPSSSMCQTCPVPTMRAMPRTRL